MDYRSDVCAPPGDDASCDEHGGDDSASSSLASQDSSDARSDAMQKRLYASAGLLGVYTCWTIFAWFIFVRAHGVGADEGRCTLAPASFHLAYRRVARVHC
jgi:hypothetical protein